LTTKSAGALSLGRGCQTGITDLTTVWQVSPRVRLLGTWTYGVTRVRSSSRPSLISFTGPLHSLDCRMGVLVLGSERFPFHCGVFYSEPRRVLSAPVRVHMPVQHLRDGSTRYHTFTTQLTPTHPIRRLEAVVETQLPCNLTLSASFSAHLSHKTHLAAVLCVKG
ncbi:MAG: hypothetical protein LBJ70_04100, partial [Holosporales bacterium]|nr:hypothetical protein [Holosporales bacterium]